MNRRVVEHPWVVIVLFGLVTAVLAARIPELEIDPDVHSMMATGDAEYLYNEWLEDYFGIADPVLLMVINDGPDGVFTPETLGLVQRLSQAVGEHPGVDDEDLVSLSEVDNITGDDDVLEVEPFFEAAPSTQREADAIRDLVFDNRMMLGTLVSRDGRATLIIAEPLEETDKIALYRDLRDLVAAMPVEDERVVIAGRPVLEGELGYLAGVDLARMFPLVLLAASTFLFLSLRSLQGILLPLLVVVSAVVWTLGFMAWIDATFFAINTIMPVLLVAIGVASGIHIIHDYLLGLAENPERPAPEVVFRTMERLTPPVVMTSLTTAGGIGALAVSPIRPVQGFGLYTALGVLACMAFSLTVLPAMLCLLPAPRRAARRTARSQSQQGGLVATLLDTLTPLVVRRPLLAMGGALVVALVGVAGIPRIVVDASLLRNFPASNPVKVADDEILAYFGGSQPMQIVLDGGADDAWKVPENLRALERLQQHIVRSGHASETRSIADFIQRMNEVMNPGDAEAYRIPDGQDLVAQYLLLYSMSGEPDDFEDVVDYGYRQANLRAQLVSDSSPAIGRAIADIESYAAKSSTASCT
jgi:predicted RND superfamily exporter protein